MVPADLEDLVAAVAVGQLIDLRCGTGVHAVKNGWTERLATLICRLEDGADAGDAEACHVTLGESGEPAADGDDVRPPCVISIMLCPARLRE